MGLKTFTFPRQLCITYQTLFSSLSLSLFSSVINRVCIELLLYLHFADVIFLILFSIVCAFIYLSLLVQFRLGRNMSTNPIELPPLPASLKSIIGILKTATDLEKHDPAVTYWTRFYACQVALGIDKSSPESKGFLAKLMFWLEKVN